MAISSKVALDTLERVISHHIFSPTLVLNNVIKTHEFRQPKLLKWSGYLLFKHMLKALLVSFNDERSPHQILASFLDSKTQWLIVPSNKLRAFVIWVPTSY